MGPTIEELDYQQTSMGELVLRRRRSPAVPDGWVYEMKIDNDMLMSSTVTVSERALARLALEGRGESPCDVLVGGLGLGYTASAVLDYPHVRRLVVVEVMAPVISWHRRRLVPMAARVMEDPRCTVVESDFFQYIGPGSSEGPYDAILLDIDHAPDSWLHTRHADFYSVTGLQALADRLKPGGVFALWSASMPTAGFWETLGSAFQSVQMHEVSFFNPHVTRMDSNWVLVAEGRPGSQPSGAAAT